MNKTFYIFLFLILFCCEARTQTNLVYNGDFEIFDTCPPMQSGNSTTLNYVKYCLGWDTPTEASSDYYNTCSSNNLSGIPLNYGGFQYPYSGNGYSGIWGLIDFSPCQYREYIQTKLPERLLTGKNYNLEYFVSLGNYQAALNSISALFTTNKISTNDDCFLVANPQIKYVSGFITDTLGWTKINGSFTAQGGEEYLTIGFFEDTIMRKGVLPMIEDSISLNSFAIYYYIDGITLSESECNINIPNVFTPNQDGVNDVLIIKTCNKIKSTSIFNRWGTKIFETGNVNHYWDGRTTSGEECVDGIYFYIVETEEEYIKGFVQLIR